MMRAFIRFSIDGDNGTLTTKMRSLLEAAGFRNIGTSAYEHSGISASALAQVRQDFWSAVESPSAAFPGVSLPPGVAFDHIWCYSGRVS